MLKELEIIYQNVTHTCFFAIETFANIWSKITDIDRN